MSRSLIIITGGGTAGHVFPALAVADALVGIGYLKEQIGFVGSRRGMEGRFVSEAGFMVHLLTGRGISRRISLANVHALFGLLFATIWSVAMMTKRRPKAVVSVGGYAALPSSIAALVLRVPVVIVNVDAAAGRANKVIARFAIFSAVGFIETQLPRAVVTGAPVREAIESVTRDRDERSRSRQRLSIPDHVRCISIVGGSLGAQRLNELGLALATALRARGDIFIYHVVGERNYQQMCDEVAKARLGPNYHCVGFTSAMEALLSASDLMVCRAGAMTVAELALTGTPAVLLPLGSAPNDHQRKNAQALAGRGGAVVLEDTTTVEAFVKRIVELIDDPSGLTEMGVAARSVGHRGSAQVIAGLVDNVVKRKPQGQVHEQVG